MKSHNVASIGSLEHDRVRAVVQVARVLSGDCCGTAVARSKGSSILDHHEVSTRRDSHSDWKLKSHTLSECHACQVDGGTTNIPELDVLEIIIAEHRVARQLGGG